MPTGDPLYQQYQGLGVGVGIGGYALPSHAAGAVNTTISTSTVPLPGLEAQRQVIWNDMWKEFESYEKRRERIVPKDIAAKLPPAPVVLVATDEPGSGHGVKCAIVDDVSSIAQHLKRIEAEKKARIAE